MAIHKSLTRKTMRITYLVARFHPYAGGTEEYTYQLARLAAKDGHEVTVITTDATPDGRKLPKSETLDGISVIRVHRWNQQLNLGFYPALLPTLLKTKADIVHCTNGPGFIWQEFCLLLKRITSHNTKFIVTPHQRFLATLDTHRGLKLFVAKIAKRIWMPYFWIIWRNLFDMFLQDNPYQVKWLTKEYKVPEHKIELVAVGIPASTIQESLPPKTDEYIGITFVGRFEYYKGVMDLAKLALNLKLLAERGELKHKFKIKLMGRPWPAGDELRAYIKRYNLQNELEIIPSPSDTERDHILCEKSHIHILPSEFEATGIVLIQAMAYGNAIITTYQNEAWSMLITPGINGAVFNYGDVEKLTELVENMINNPKKLHQMQQKNLELRYKFTWEDIYPDYAKLLAKLV